MRNKKLSIRPTVLFAMFAVATLMTATRAVTQTEKVLHSFNNNGKDGYYPTAGLTLDASDNLYGTTTAGGMYGVGMAFELTPKVGGGWVEKLLHNFRNNGIDGSTPEGRLIFDAVGNLYGTTYSGGGNGTGTVFKLIPLTNGAWGEKILFNFPNNGTNGGGSQANLIFDASGNLYGTTAAGGAYGYGTVFELKPNAGGGWAEEILHNFNKDGTDGCFPNTGVIFDGSGSLYGTTSPCGANSHGTIFELVPQTGGSWSEKILHDFGSNGTDGQDPLAGLVFDASGNLYGTTAFGGTYSCGTVFELTAAVGGSWSETVLHSFNCTDGALADGVLLFDTAGNLYGTTYGASSGFDFGNAFELTPGAGGIWTETVLHAFNYNDGAFPVSGLIRDSSGNLYGTTWEGGAPSCAGGCGTVFEIKP